MSNQKNESAVSIFGRNMVLSIIPILFASLGFLLVELQDLRKRILILEQRLIDVSDKRIDEVEKDIAILKDREKWKSN